ncbi:ATP-binding cassette domain-containing protein [Streptacidiphilus sp. EB129]|uniref:ABC transporter ATP-binding protein n=1 Tax=Streptacidiphilus sp. EB129 TaxID=3156262 RepID=UPI0035123FA8
MRLEGVCVRYGWREPWVLRDVTLELPEGRLIRARGGNGGGKSTLLRVAAGVCAPTRGGVRDRPARRAYVPERFPAALPFTAHDYLCHLGRIHGLRGQEPARRATAALERFGAGAFAATPLAQLSKGTCQKVAVAQALLGEPDLLVLDEAWTGLDQDARDALDDAVDERLRRDGTVLFVDHDPLRLAGVPAVHWQVGDARVRESDTARATAALRLTFSNWQGRHDRPRSEDGPRSDDGLCSDDGPSGRKLSELPGVRSVRELPDQRFEVEVDAAHGDDLLRTLLADPAVHIESVR